jgi:hypothetical protein
MWLGGLDCRVESSNLWMFEDDIPEKGLLVGM